MVGRVVGTIAVLGVAYLVVTSLPDLARYLKIRNM